MTMRRGIPRGLAVLAAAALAAGTACGGTGRNDRGLSAAAKATAASSSGPGATMAPVADVHKIVLMQADVPADWTAEPADAGGDDKAVTDAFNTCVGAELVRDGDTADSPDFTAPDSLTSVSSSAELAPSTAALEQDWAVLQGPKLLPCLARSFDTMARADIGDDSVTVSPVQTQRIAYPQVGDGAMAIRATTTITGAHKQVPLALDFVFIRKGLAEITLYASGGGQPFPSQLLGELGAVLTSRV
ncbi:MAG TPA: hypothetical protein VFJ85_00385 [Acidimicrobiales bacterium]|nr:hypothetical protein [Acidimicrobiales bacterium]